MWCGSKPVSCGCHLWWLRSCLLSGGALKTPGLVWPVRPTAARPWSSSLLSSSLDLAWVPWWSSLLCGLLDLALLTPGNPHQPLPGVLLLCASGRICMSGPLLDVVRAVIATLRSAANTLESALARAEVGLPSSAPAAVSDLESGHSWEIPPFPSSSAARPGSPRPTSAPGLPPSPARTNYSTNSYHEVADTLPVLPGYCVDWCIRLGNKEEIVARANRAWQAGCWAKATVEGRVPKPRPTPPISLRSTVYIILRAPGIDRPVRVSSAAEYFRIIPSFKGATGDSISHSFPSLAEARVYCAAFGIDLPEQQ